MPGGALMGDMVSRPAWPGAAREALRRNVWPAVLAACLAPAFFGSDQPIGLRAGSPASGPVIFAALCALSVFAGIVSLWSP
jgi:hypothetical protein